MIDLWGIVRATDLDLSELLDLQEGGGVIRFAGERALLLDATALGLLRKELIGTLGVGGARGVLTRFGYSHGWRVAESLRDGFPWDDPGEWRRAGARLHMLQGIVRVEPDPSQVEGPTGLGLWRDSYEAEQHLLHLGQSDQPVCWSLSGFASGYMSCCWGRPIYALETDCVGRGDPVCRIEARPRDAWDEDRLATLAPYYESECLEATLARVTQELRRTERRLRTRRRKLKRLSAATTEDDGLVVRSEAMRRVVDVARRAAKVDATVLVIGESGVGKERVAQLIHDASRRAAGPFLAINCGAISESLIESELFGHVRGAFTGATQDRVGLFEAAHGGTLLLDEVGELSPALQVKLLRVLQEREVRRVGENTKRPIDVRLVAATNRDMGEAVGGGAFRRDLYYRLKVVELRVPPLRERPDDVLPLARALLTLACARLGRRLSGFSPQAADQLLRHPWPGNVRELQNAIERAVVVTDGERIGVEDLPEEVRCSRSAALRTAAGEVRPLEEVEREAILAALEANDGNRAATAGQLGIGTATLYRKLRKYGQPRAAPGP